MIDLVGWNRIILEQPPPRDELGLVALEGRRYATLRECARFLGTTLKMVKIVWRASWRKLNAEGWGYFDDDAPTVNCYRYAREDFVPVDTIQLLIAQAALPPKRKAVLLFHFHALERERKFDERGLFWGSTYGRPRRAQLISA